MMPTLIAVGLVLTSATQLRLGGLPLGPGEICLAIWAGMAVVRLLCHGGPRLRPAASRMLLFWAMFAFAEALGALNGYAMGDRHDTELFLHDAMAYSLVGAIGCLLLVDPEADVRLPQVASRLLVLGTVSLTLQLGAGWGVLSFPGIEPWFWDRFRGWSNNSNQLAFFCEVLLLVALHAADSATRASQRIGALISSIPIILVGRLTKTDSFTFALLAATPMFLFMKLRAWMVVPEAALTLRRRVAALGLVAAPLFLFSFVPLAASNFGNAEQFALGLTKGGGKEATQEADLRLELWGEAIERGMQAHMLGLGPGPHLPIPSSIVLARMEDSGADIDPHPEVGNTPNFEAHNTFLDLFAQGGLIAVASLVWLVASSFRTSYRAHAAGLSAVVCGLLVFSLTNLTLREPMFWFAIALCLLAADAAPRRVPVASRSVRKLTADACTKPAPQSANSLARS